MMLSEGQMSDYKAAALMIDALPSAKAMLGDRGYDADWFRAALIAKGIEPCIPSKVNRKIPIPHDRALYRQRHSIENMFNKLKTGAASTPAMTDAPTPAGRPSASPQPSSSGCNQ